MNHKDLIEKLDCKSISTVELMDYAIKNNLNFSWHPLGFVVCKLYGHNNVTVRLHIWPANGGKPQCPTWEIHDHTFSFKSWVLVGSVINTEYEINNQESIYSIYEVNYTSDGSRLSRTESIAGVNLYNELQVEAGGTYEINAGSFHKSKNCSQGLTVTVIEAINSNMNAPRVLGDLAGEAHYFYKRAPLSENEIISLRNELGHSK